MEGVVFFAIIFLWALPLIAAIIVGSEKGRTMMGFSFGGLFGVFGLIAIAAMQPSPVVQARRDQALARATADAIAAQQLGQSEFLRRCPACLSTIHRLAKVCPHCTRDVPPALVVGEDDVLEGLTVGVTISGFGESAEDAGELMLVVQPGWVTISTCDDNCDDLAHELMMTSEVALELLTSVRDVASGDATESLQREGHGVVTVERLPSEDGEPPAVVIDWTDQFLSGPDRKLHLAGEYVETSSHGLLVLDGELASRGSAVSVFVNSFAASVDLASLWELGQVSKFDVREALSPFGIVDD